MIGAYKAVSVLALACSLGLSGIVAQAQGRVFVWGDNSFGQLGNGTTIGSNVPMPAVGIDHVVSAASGSDFSVAVKSDGTVWTWGVSLGNASGLPNLTPVQIPGLTHAVSVVAGSSHCVVLKSDGTVWAVGLDYIGQLGNGLKVDTTTPVQVLNLGLIVAIAAKGDWSMALKSDGTVWTWGDNTYGQLGDSNWPLPNRPYPSIVTGLYGVSGIAAGMFHGMALKPDGSVWTWGGNQFLQLGVNSIFPTSTPVQVIGLPAVRHIAAGNFFSLAMDNGGFIESWGNNTNGQIGNGTAQYSSGLTTVNGAFHPTAIDGGEEHSIAIAWPGVWTWGGGAYGQLGNGSSVDSYLPVQVNGLPLVTSVSAGGYNSLAVEAIGTLPSKITLSSASGPKGCSTSVAATLKEGATPLAGGTVQFAMDGVNLGSPGTTDANGQAKLIMGVTEDMAIGAHSLTVSFAGNAYYASSTAHSTLMVTPGPVTVYVTNVSAHAGSNMTIMATLRNLNGNRLSGARLTFTVAGAAAGSAVTDDMGDAQLSGQVPAGTAKGTYPVVVSFAGDSNHLAGSGSGTITIK